MKVDVYAKSKMPDGEIVLKVYHGETTDFPQFSVCHRGRRDWMTVHNMSGLMVRGGYDSKQKALDDLRRLVDENELIKSAILPTELESRFCYEHHMLTVPEMIESGIRVVIV
ncbi:MAG: hypothetical protein IIY75_09300 [Erysipelotrichales bacterium]|nr:hypothetical protein [Erysipelotrichales bacterium]